MGAAKLGLGRQEEVADPALLENALGGRAAGSQRGPALGAVEESQRRAHMAFDAGAVIERDVGIGAKMCVGGVDGAVADGQPAGIAGEVVSRKRTDAIVWADIVGECDVK